MIGAQSWAPSAIAPSAYDCLSFVRGGTTAAIRSLLLLTLPSAMTDRKRKLDLGDAVSNKSSKPPSEGAGINPWTNRPYSKRYSEILEGRLKLPVYQFKEKLLDAVAKNQIVVLEGETGSGELLVAVEVSVVVPLLIFVESRVLIPISLHFPSVTCVSLRTKQVRPPKSHNS